jgi:hypothetical protein
MVTIQWIIERLIGDRGSKSVFNTCNLLARPVNTKFYCKRATSIRQLNRDKNSVLRCTLTGFERSYQFRILSKQIIKYNSYSTLGGDAALNSKVNPMDP